MDRQLELLRGLIGRWRTMLPFGCERIAVTLLASICFTIIFSTAVVQTLVVILTVVVVACHVRGNAKPFQRTPLDLPYAVFVAGRIMSIAFSRYPAESIAALHREYFFYIVFFLVTQTVRHKKVAVSRTMVHVLVAAGVLAGFIGTAKVLLFNDMRASSTTAGPYTLGAYLCPVLALAILFVLRNKRGIAAAWRWMAPAAIILGIIFTYDRLHWAGMVVMLSLVGVFSRRRRLFYMVASGFLIVLLFPSLRFRLDQTIDIKEFMAGRDVLWRGALQLAGDHPLVGFGPRTFSHIFPLFDQMPVKGVGSWHNDYLQVYLESGLMGLLPLLWILAVTMYTGWRVLRLEGLKPDIRHLLQAFLMFLGVTFVLGGILDTLVGIAFRIVLGLFALLAGSIDELKEASER